MKTGREDEMGQWERKVTRKVEIESGKTVWVGTMGREAADKRKEETEWAGRVWRIELHNQQVW
jgi:hypothetical protein